MGTYKKESLVENRPSAEVLAFSIRALGYTFESAIADVVDNSISAHASEIEIKFPTNPSELFVCICDNGDGMTKDELFDAMTYGSRLKQKNRSEDDLGRFGLGLKSASHSQCRKLTVISKKNDVVSACIWDLDVIKDGQDWYMVDCTEEDIKKFKYSNYLDDKKSGTVVIWEDFDVIRDSSSSVYAELTNYTAITADYLSLIYHRFLNRSTNRIKIKVNNFELKGFDPFLENHPKTTIRKAFNITLEDQSGVEREVTVQPYVLPFQKDLSDDDKKLSGGIENYKSKQGFYIYRNERLIIWGTWFGRSRDELTKYARIKVDIPNTLDSIWGIDIKKQTAKIPSSIKKRLTRAVDDAMDVAVKKQTYRGRIAKIDDKTDYVWKRIENRGNYEYKINRDAKVFDLVKNRIDEDTWNTIEEVFEEIEDNIPYQQIYIDKSQNTIAEDISDERKADIIDKARALIMIKKNVDKDSSYREIIDSLLLIEPFNKCEGLKDKLMEYFND